MIKIKKLNIGIIGLGVGEAHLKSYKEIPNVEVKSICDIDPVRLKLIADNYNISGRYTESKFITEDPNIDMNNSWVIGDKEVDISAANNANIANNVLVRSGHKIDEESSKAKYIINSINDLKEIIY